MDIKEKVEQILNILDSCKNDDESYEVLARVTKECDLEFASNIIRSHFDNISKSWFMDMLFDEGDENAGVVRLKQLLDILEEIINTEGNDYCHGDIKFSSPLRIANEEEYEENGWNKNIDWWVVNDSIDIEKTMLGFDVK